jgi:hypothetical protein
VLLAVVLAAGGYAYYKDVRSWGEFVDFVQDEWDRLTGQTPEMPDIPQTPQTPVKPETPKPTPKVDDTTTSAPEAVTVEGPEEGTNKFNIFAAAEDEEYNPLIIGHWQCVDRPTWHRVYTEEYSGNGYYWGKEWDEAEDVTEEDLVDYGNGWYEWKMDGADVLELATSDMSESRVPFIYTIKKLSDGDLIYIEQRSSDKRVFKRLNE